MAVGADEVEILQPRGLVRPELRQGNSVVALDEAIAEVAIHESKIESADFALKATLFTRNFRLLCAHEGSIALEHFVHAKKDPAFRSLFDLHLFDLSHPRLALFTVSSDRHGDFVEVVAVVCEFPPDLLFIATTAHEALSLVRRVESEEVAELHVDAIGVPKPHFVGTDAVDGKPVEEIAEVHDSRMRLRDLVGTMLEVEIQGED
jgi:hypothetical protein